MHKDWFAEQNCGGPHCNTTYTDSQLGATQGSHQKAIFLLRPPRSSEGISSGTVASRFRTVNDAHERLLRIILRSRSRAPISKEQAKRQTSDNSHVDRKALCSHCRVAQRPYTVAAQPCSYMHEMQEVLASRPRRPMTYKRANPPIHATKGLFQNMGNLPTDTLQMANHVLCSAETALTSARFRASVSRAGLNVRKVWASLGKRKLHFRRLNRVFVCQMPMMNTSRKVFCHGVLINRRPEPELCCL